MLLTELHEIDHLEEDCSRVRLLTHKKEFVKSQEEDDRVVKEVLRR